MGLNTRICENLGVEWTVEIPRTGAAVDSNAFNLDSKAWYFRIANQFTTNPSKGLWTLYLVKYHKENMPRKFLLTSYVKRNNVTLFINHKVIAKYETQVFSNNFRILKNEYPEADSENTLTFCFVFDKWIQNFEDFQSFEYDHKAVQTSPLLDDRFCLQNLSRDLGKVIDDSSNSDVQLKCGDCTLSTHKLVLGARSEVFRTMLESDMVEGREGSVEIVDMEPDVFKIFIRYLYTGILPELTQDTASSLYEAGDKYQVKSLKKRCGDFLAENLTLENACAILFIADAHSDKDLKERVVSYIVDEKIPDNDDEWLKFSDDHPKLANEVYRRAYKQLLATAR